MSQEEGVVKYSLEFEKTSACPFICVEEIEEIREDLYALGLIGAYSDGIGFGNISQREGGSRDFFITGTQTGQLASLVAKDYFWVEKVDFETFTTYASGASEPSSEAITHACIYELDSKINAIIQVHNERLWRYILQNDFVSTGDVEYGSLEMVEDIKKIYEKQNALKKLCFCYEGAL